MNPSIYFHIDELARESVVASNLKKILKKRGIDLFYGNRFFNQFLTKYSPCDAYVFPKPDFIKLYHTGLGNAPVVILPTEGIGFSLTSDLNYMQWHYLGLDFKNGITEWAEKAFAYCFWGNDAANIVRTELPHKTDSICITGHPRLDKHCWAKQNSQKNDKIKIGLISRFDSLNPFDKRQNLETIYVERRKGGGGYWIPEGRDIEDHFFMLINDLRILYEVMDHLDPKTYEIELRPHPRENRLEWEKLVKKHQLPIKLAQWDQPFVHWMANQDHLIGPSSTSYYDCLMMGKVPICTNDIYPQRNDHIIAGSDDQNPIAQFVHRPKSMEELFELVKHKNTTQTIHPEAMAILEKETHYPHCLQSLETLAETCIKAVEESKKRKTTASWKDRMAFLALCKAHNIYSWYKYPQDQSAIFSLNSKRKQWIDNLAG